MPSNTYTTTPTTPVARNEVNDLIGNPPSWLLRSGISLVGIVFFTLLFLSNFIQYPDKVQGMGMLTATSPPIELLSQSNGKIETILVRDGQKVKQGDVLLYIHNTTNPAEIAQLNAWIEEYERVKSLKGYLDIKIPKQLQVGVLQTEYAALCLRIQEFQQVLQNNIIFQQSQNLTAEVEKTRTLNASQGRENGIYAQELALAKKDYLRNEQLNKEGVISDIDFERTKVSLLQKERQYEGMEKFIIKNKITIDKLELEKLRLQGERSNTLEQHQFAIAEIIARLKSGIENWYHTYSVEAPIDGEVSFQSVLIKNKSIKMEQILGYILPTTDTEKYLSCTLPTTNIGKVEKGQRAIIKFDAYPYKEFGLVLSKVNSMSQIPNAMQDNQQFYELKIPLSDPILTDFGEEIPYKPNMGAMVEIITKDQSILERIFDQFLSLIKDN